MNKYTINYIKIKNNNNEKYIWLLDTYTVFTRENS